MPAYSEPLSEYLTNREMDQLIKCIEGEEDLIGDNYALYMKLFEYYMPDMPYEVAKADTQDPGNWIILKTQLDLGFKWVNVDRKMVLVRNMG